MPTTYAVPDGRVAMAATLYTGNGTSQSINNAVNGVSFQPDFVWYKDRSVARDHGLFDVIRGALDLLSSNTTGAASSVAGTLTSFNSNGYSIGSTSNANGNGETYVGWQWKAGGAGSSNTNGSITSTVSVNATAGFSVVTYTGTGANATVGHGLGVAPKMIIVKRRSASGSWTMWNANLSTNNYLWLNSTASQVSDSTAFNGYTGNSSTFNVGTNTDLNANTATYVAYCWAEVAGYSKFGSYTGNGSSDGPFVYLGFRPKFIMIKASSSTGNWTIVDTSRDTYNVLTAGLYPNLSNAESNPGASDILSNGFKMRNTFTDVNGSGTTYIYAAFAENPFKYANAR